MQESKTGAGSFEANIRKQTARLAYWTFAWLVSMALANFGPTFIWQSNELLTMVAIGANVLIGVGMILANKGHLQSLDEMQQKIHLEAMGLALGVGLVFGLAYSNLDVTNVIAFDAEISHLVILVGLTYLGTVVALTRKYR